MDADHEHKTDEGGAQKKHNRHKTNDQAPCDTPHRMPRRRADGPAQKNDDAEDRAERPAHKTRHKRGQNTLLGERHHQEETIRVRGRGIEPRRKGREETRNSLPVVECRRSGEQQHQTGPPQNPLQHNQRPAAPPRPRRTGLLSLRLSRQSLPARAAGLKGVTLRLRAHSDSPDDVPDNEEQEEDDPPDVRADTLPLAGSGGLRGTSPAGTAVDPRGRVRVGARGQRPPGTDRPARQAGTGRPPRRSRPAAVAHWASGPTAVAHRLTRTAAVSAAVSDGRPRPSVVGRLRHRHGLLGGHAHGLLHGHARGLLCALRALPARSGTRPYPRGAPVPRGPRNRLLTLRDSAPHSPHLLLDLSTQHRSRIGLGALGRRPPTATHSLPVLQPMLRGIVEHRDIEQRRTHKRVTKHRPERRLIKARATGHPPDRSPGVNILAISRYAHSTRISRPPPNHPRSPPGLPTHPLHRDRFEAPGGHQRPRKVTLTRALSTALRSARIVEPQRRADPRRVQPCWSPRKCAGDRFSARRRPAQGAPRSRQALISRCRAAGPLPARSEPRSGQGPTAMKGPRGGTLLGTTDPHE